MDLRNEVALVTGAARGIGRGIATELARAGAHVAIADLLSVPEVAEAAEQTARAVETYGGRALLVDCDVSSEAACQAMVDDTVAGLGEIGVLVCNAGIAGIGGATDTSVELWERVFAVNTRGTFLSCRAVLPRLAARGGGSIVNIASTLGLRTGAGRVAYSASKFAVIGFSQALADEVAKDRIRVNCICPSSVRSEMTLGELQSVTGVESRDEADALWTKVSASRLPLGRSVEPEDIGRAVVWLCEADMVTGISLPVTGGEGLGT